MSDSGAKVLLTLPRRHIASCAKCGDPLATLVGPHCYWRGANMTEWRGADMFVRGKCPRCYKAFAIRAPTDD